MRPSVHTEGIGVRMRLASLSFKNWRNFKSVDVPVGDRLLIVGPNAAGKSNLLDGLRFLRDIADTGGGLQHAVETRGGMGRIRCLVARNFNHGRVGLRVELRDPDRDAVWSYELHLTAEPRGRLPQIDALQLVRDSAGAPHLQARYQHWREQGVWQDERDLSDGTLRLIGLLSTLQDKSSKSNRVILLEEPELSLHAAVVRKLPAVLSRVTRRDVPQVILSTHSAEMLSDPGLGLDEVVVLSPDAEGTTAQMASEIEGARELVDAGINLREILESRTQPPGIDQLLLFK